jgi:rhamnosyl/mannosyltransferase
MDPEINRRADEVDRRQASANRPGRRAASLLKILHVGKFLPPSFGGMERALHAMATGMAGRRHAVRVLVHADGDAMAVSEVVGVRVMRAPYALRIGTMPLSLTYLDTYRRWSQWADIVHFHQPFPPSAIGFCILPKPKCVVVSWHSDIVRQRILRPAAELFQARLCACATRIICSTARMRDQSPMLAPWRDKCSVIGFGLDIKRFQDACADRSGIDGLQRRFGGRFALAVGRLVSYKGLDVLLRALVDTDVRLVIVGDGPLENDLKRLQIALGLNRRVAFVGGISDAELATYYAACDFLVLPSISRAETFGIVQIEAMACGKPVINTALPTGVPDVSVDGLTGITVPPSDVPALSAALGMLWRDPSLIAALGAQARDRIEVHYTSDATTADLERLYRAVVAERIAPLSSINPIATPTGETATVT